MSSGAVRPPPRRPPSPALSTLLLLLALLACLFALPAANAFLFLPAASPPSPGRTPLVLRASSSSNHQHSRKDLLTQVGSLLLGTSVLGSAARPAQAWCGKPYPRWAYGLRFNDGLIQIPLPGLTKPADVFIRVVGDEGKEKEKKVAPVVIFPGGPGLAHDYTETLEALVYAERRVIAFDPVGTGQSSPTLPPSLLSSSGTTEEEREQAWSDMIQIQVKETLKFLEIESEHHVWAHGAGCLPAIQYTSSLPSSSSLRVKSLTLASPFIFSPGKKSLPSFYSNGGVAVPFCVTESVAGGGKEEGGREEGVFYNKRLEGLPALGALGGGGGEMPVFVSYSEKEDGALGLDEAAVGRLKKRVEEGGKEGGRAKVVVKKFEGRVPHIDRAEPYVDWLDEMFQGVEKRPAA